MTEPTTTFQFHPDNTLPTGDWIFVFGSNLAGRHGKGAAKIARNNFRAQYGTGSGPTGHAYAIPTKKAPYDSGLPLESIERSIDEFLRYAQEHPKLNFFVTRVGCGEAGYTDEQIGPLFASAPPNCSLPDNWRGSAQQYRAQLAATPPAAPAPNTASQRQATPIRRSAEMSRAAE